MSFKFEAIDVVRMVSHLYRGRFYPFIPFRRHFFQGAFSG